MICPSQIIGKASDKHNLMVPDTDTYVRFSLLKIIYFINHTFPSPFHTLQGSLVYTDEPSHAFIQKNTSSLPFLRLKTECIMGQAFGDIEGLGTFSCGLSTSMTCICVLLPLPSSNNNHIQQLIQLSYVAVPIIFLELFLQLLCFPYYLLIFLGFPLPLLLRLQQQLYIIFQYFILLLQPTHYLFLSFYHQLRFKIVFICCRHHAGGILQKLTNVSLFQLTAFFVKEIITGAFRKLNYFFLNYNLFILLLSSLNVFLFSFFIPFFHASMPALTLQHTLKDQNSFRCQQFFLYRLDLDHLLCKFSHQGSN